MLNKVIDVISAHEWSRPQNSSDTLTISIFCRRAQSIYNIYTLLDDGNRSLPNVTGGLVVLVDSW